LLPLPVSAAYAAGQTLYSICIIRKVVVTRMDVGFGSLFKAAFLASVVLFCSECKWFGGVITIKSVNTVAPILSILHKAGHQKHNLSIGYCEFFNTKSERRCKLH
jgi:hypothetical protein